MLDLGVIRRGEPLDTKEKGVAALMAECQGQMAMNPGVASTVQESLPIHPHHIQKSL